MARPTTATPVAPAARSGWHRLLKRYLRVRAYVLLGLFVIALVLLAGMIWRNLTHFETVRLYVDYAHRIQQATFDLQRVLADHFAHPTGHPLPDDTPALIRELDALAQEDHHVDPATPSRLQYVRDRVMQAESSSGREDREAALLLAINATSEMLDAETMRRETLLEQISEDTRSELALASAVVVAMLFYAALFLRHRIFAPLHDLRDLLMRMADEDYTPIGTGQIDPLLLPVFQSYNEMVRRVAELEEAKRNYAASLEGEVRSATRALLELQAEMARAERLAAVGELAASVAHELRNPLAGIQMTCANLLKEVEDSDQRERLDLVIGELKRMGRLLNELLAQSRHVPDAPGDIDIAQVVRELVVLTRYQIPTQVNLLTDIPENLIGRIPESRFRQALLNLILNASVAIGEAGGTIRISAARMPEGLRVIVSDDGPGFPPDVLEHGIRPFATGRADGTGLGLAMVRRFARDFGGDLRLSNQVPRGACITIDLPAPDPDRHHA